MGEMAATLGLAGERLLVARLRVDWKAGGGTFGVVIPNEFSREATTVAFVTINVLVVVLVP
jgi:hypothetical protein